MRADFSICRLHNTRCRSARLSSACDRGELFFGDHPASVIVDYCDCTPNRNAAPLNSEIVRTICRLAAVHTRIVTCDNPASYLQFTHAAPPFYSETACVFPAVVAYDNEKITAAPSRRLAFTQHHPFRGFDALYLIYRS